jgi:integrase/recombinase XerD
MKKSNILTEFSEIIHSRFTSKATLKTYSKVAEKFIHDNHPDSIDKLTKDYLLRYLNQFNPSYFNQYLSVLKILYKDVFKQKYKLKDIKPIKVERKLKNIPSSYMIKSVLDNIKNIKHYTIIITFASTGIRMDELLNIRLLDVDSNKMKILILKGKGGRSRFIKLDKKLLKQFKIYYEIYKPKYYLFEGQKKDKYTSSSVNKFIKKHFGEDYHAHLFRHYYMTYMINNDVNPHKLQNMSGHKSYKSVTWYYQYSDDALEHNINPINELQYENRN